MPLQNRVTPFNTIEAVASRGLVMGNRGCLCDEAGRLRNQGWRTKSWIICRLEWKGHWRPVMQAGVWTELFFLDEAVALAAGHRPCAYCWRENYRRFLDCWAEGNGWEATESEGARPLRQPDLDAALHADRLDGKKRQRHHEAALDGLPDGCFVLLPENPKPWLVRGDRLFPWSHAGYGAAVPRPAGIAVSVITPASTVAAIAAGYAPLVHPSAG